MERQGSHAESGSTGREETAWLSNRILTRRGLINFAGGENELYRM